VSTPTAVAKARGGDAAGRVLVVGVGNVLRGDDMFGMEVAALLRQEQLPSSVTIVETGTAGISLVQELLSGYDALLIIDAVEQHRVPGTLVLLEPQVPDPTELSETQRREFSADLHQTDPSRALMLAKAVGCLPQHVLILGCEVGDCDELLVELTPAVRDALAAAVSLALDTICGWLGPPAASEVSA